MTNEKTAEIQDQPKSITSHPEQEQSQTTKETVAKDNVPNESERLAKQRRRASTYSDPNYAGLEEVHRMFERLAESRAQQAKGQESQKKTEAVE